MTDGKQFHNQRGNIMKMKKIAILTLLALSATFKSHGLAEVTAIIKLDSPAGKPAEQKKDDTKKNKDGNLLAKRAIFMNSRVNDIILVIADHKNNSHTLPIKMGQRQEIQYYNTPTKAICYEKLTPKTALTKSDFETYTAFVFNDQQKTDKFHFFNLYEKSKALDQARKAKNLEKFQEISDQVTFLI